MLGQTWNIDPANFDLLDAEDIAATIFRVTPSGPNACPEIVEVHPLGQIE